MLPATLGAARQPDATARCGLTPNKARRRVVRQPALFKHAMPSGCCTMQGARVPGHRAAKASDSCQPPPRRRQLPPCHCSSVGTGWPCRRWNGRRHALWQHPQPGACLQVGACPPLAALDSCGSPEPGTVAASDSRNRSHSSSSAAAAQQPLGCPVVRQAARQRGAAAGQRSSGAAAPRQPPGCTAVCQAHQHSSGATSSGSSGATSQQPPGCAAVQASSGITHRCCCCCVDSSGTSHRCEPASLWRQLSPGAGWRGACRACRACVGGAVTRGKGGACPAPCSTSSGGCSRRSSTRAHNTCAAW